MQYNDHTCPPFNAKELKKRLEDIQGEIRYISYTAEVLSKELRSLVLKLENVSDELLSQSENDFLSELMVAHE